jgi:hypothetical protein
VKYVTWNSSTGTLLVSRPFVTSYVAPSAVIASGSSAAGSLCASEPPSVPRFRTRALPTFRAAAARSG